MRFLVVVLIMISVGCAAWAADVPGAADVHPSLVADAGTGTASNTSEPAQMTPPNGGAEPENQEKKNTAYALTIGDYMPTNSLVRDAFGRGFLRLGIRPLPTYAPHNWRFAYDVNFVSLSSLNGTATLIPITAGMLRRFGENELRSYAAINVGPCYANVKLPALAIDQNGWPWDANVTLGIVFQEKYSIEARYDYVSTFAGLDFSSITVSATIKIFSGKF